MWSLDTLPCDGDGRHDDIFVLQQQQEEEEEQPKFNSIRE
jgi:hypothetical protein